MLVFDNKAFVLSEVANEQLASSIVRNCPPIDVGENIKLYCMTPHLPDPCIEHIHVEY